MFRDGGNLGHGGRAAEFRNRAMRLLGLGLVAALSWMVLVSAWGQPRVSTVVLAVLVWSAGTWTATRLLVRPSAWASPDGLVVVNPFRTHHIGWSEVLAVTHGTGPVRVHRRNGAPVALWSSVELAPVRGEHPHAERVASDLSRLLDLARAHHRPASPRNG